MTRTTKESIIYGLCVVVIFLSLGALYVMASACIPDVNYTEVLG